MSKQAKANLVPWLRFPEFRAKPGKRTQFRSA